MVYLFSILFFVLLVGAFRPYKFAPVARRWHYGLGAVVSLAMVGAFAPEDVEQRAVDASAKAAPGADVTRKNKAAAIDLYNKVQAVAAPCDQAWKSFAPALDGDDVVNAYIEAENASSACLGVPGAMRDLDVPSRFEGSDQEQLEAALGSCEEMALNRWNIAQSIKQVLDGDSSVSKLADIKRSADLVQSHAMLCAGNIVAVAVKYGATSKELGLPDD